MKVRARKYCWVIFYHFLSAANIFQNYTFQKFLSGTLLVFKYFQGYLHYFTTQLSYRLEEEVFASLVITGKYH